MKDRTGAVSELLNDALQALRSGRIDEAERAVRAALAAAPETAEAHNALGVVLRAGGRLEEAEASYRRALDLQPGHPRALNNLADVARQRGDDAEAIVLARRAIDRDSRMVEPYKILAQSYFSLGRLDEAAAAIERGLRVGPSDPTLHLFLGKIEHDRHNFPAACAAYRKYLESRPDDSEILADLGAALLERGRDEEALEPFERATALDPDYAPAEFGLRETISRLVPSWHIPMMNEPQRNLAYRAAIRELVGPDDHVLEIGTGAGLLALFAAEAGARQVTTCEMVRIVADAAREVIDRSAYADRIRLVSKRSTDLQLGEDLAEPADLLVSEILANDFVGEGVLPSLIDAKKRLLKPDARIIPATGELRGVLVGGEHIEYLLDLGDVCGFDMRSFARLRPWRQFIPQRIDYDAFSDDVTLLHYDFANLQSLEPVDRVVPVTATRGGRCYGLLQWIAVGLTPSITYENHPRAIESVWNKVLYAFSEPLDLSPGEVVPIRLWQRDAYLYVSDVPKR